MDNDQKAGVFLLIRFPANRYQLVKESLARCLSNSRDYWIGITGISKKICVLKGFFPSNKAIALVPFRSFTSASSFIETLPEGKQSYFSDGVDLILLPACDFPPAEHNVCYLNDLRFDAADDHLLQNSPIIKAQLEAGGAFVWFVFASEHDIKRVKGPWNPKFLLMSSWPSSDAFQEYYRSDSIVERVSRRHDFVDTIYCVFELEPIIKKNELPAFIIIRFPSDLIEIWKHFVFKSMPIYKVETSYLAGISKKVSVSEGNYPQSKGVAILSFGSVREAELWKDSVPEIRQHDWMDGVDMVIAPVCKMPPGDKRFVQMIDLRFHNVSQYLAKYSNDVERKVQDAGACTDVVSACAGLVHNVSGSWNPNYLCLHFWPSEAAFDESCKTEYCRSFCGQYWGNIETCTYALQNLQEPVFIMFRFPVVSAQKCKKFLMVNAPAYKEEVLGISKKVSVLEGVFSKTKRFAITMFASSREAHFWLDSNADFKLPDNNIDVLIVPICTTPPSDKRFIELVHLNFDNVNPFLSENSNCVDAGNCCEAVSASSENIMNCAGQWKPKYLMVKFWSSEAAFEASFHSETYRNLRRRYLKEMDVCSFLLKSIQVPIFVIIRFPISRVQPRNNPLMKKLLCHKSYYQGDVSGISHQVCILEGNFPQSKGVAILSFGSLREAELWKDSVPEIRQHDWMDGVDMVIAPVCKMPPGDKRFVQMIDLRFHNVSQYLAVYSSGVDKQLRDAGACGGVVSACANRIHKVKGLWDPFCLVLNFWPSQSVFEASYNSEFIRELHQNVFYEGETSFAVTFNLELLKSFTETAVEAGQESSHGEICSKRKKSNDDVEGFETERDIDDDVLRIPVTILSTNPEDDEEDIIIFDGQEDPDSNFASNENRDIGPTDMELLLDATCEVTEFDMKELCSICGLVKGDKRAISKITKCNHTFHRSCLYELLQHSSSCPLCRCSLL